MDCLRRCLISVSAGRRSPRLPPPLPPAVPGFNRFDTARPSTPRPRDTFKPLFVFFFSAAASSLAPCTEAIRDLKHPLPPRRNLTITAFVHFLEISSKNSQISRHIRILNRIAVKICIAGPRATLHPAVKLFYKLQQEAQLSLGWVTAPHMSEDQCPTSGRGKKTIF